jgi:vitamin B12 transporter
MNRRWVSFGFLCLLCIGCTLPNSAKSNPLVIDVIGQKNWADALAATGYVSEGINQTPEESRNALESLPSLNLKKMGGSGQVSILSFRGQPSSNTHLLIDDIPVQDAGGNINFSPLFGGATRLVAVIPGSSGVLYGSGASGGVVLMETPFSESNNTATAEVGSFQSAYTHLSHQKKTPETRWIVHGEGSRTAGLPQYGGKRKLGEKGRSDLANIATVFEHRFDSNNTLKFTGRSLESRAKYDTYDTYLNPLSKPQGTQTTTLSLLGATFKNFSRNTSHKVHGFLSQNRLKNTQTPESKILMSGTNYVGSHYFNSRLISTLLLGIQENRIESNDIKKNVVFTTYGGLIQKAHLTHQISAEVGLRSDHHQKFGKTSTYSVAGSFSHNNTLLKGGMRTGFLNPSLYSLYVTNDFVEGNPNLKPEKTQTVDLSIEQKIPTQNLCLQVTPFWTQIRKMVHTSLQRGKYRSQNISGVSKISGLESRVIHVISKRIKTVTSHAYTNFNLSQKNINPEFPKHKAHFKIDYIATPSTTLTSGIAHTGKRKSYQGESLKKYTLVHFSIKHDLRPGMVIFGRIDNVFDTRYVQTRGYQTQGRALYVGTHLRF